MEKLTDERRDYLRRLGKGSIKDYYLNDYHPSDPRFRIEEHRGGNQCRWHARTSLKRMEETKRYLEKVWA